MQRLLCWYLCLLCCWLQLVASSEAPAACHSGRLQCAEQRAAAAARELAAAEAELEQARSQAASAAADDEVEATVSRLLADMTVAEKARALDIFRTADMLSNGVVNMTKAAESWGDLSLGFGGYHRFRSCRSRCSCSG